MVDATSDVEMWRIEHREKAVGRGQENTVGAMTDRSLGAPDAPARRNCIHDSGMVGEQLRLRKARVRLAS